MTRTPSTLLAQLGRWAPPVLVMTVIFGLSAQPDLSTGLGTWDYVLRKLVHMGEYGLLWLTWRRALRGIAPQRLAVALAFAVSIAYAASDEYHQSFVAGRHGTPVDVAIDAVGMGIAAAAVRAR